MRKSLILNYFLWLCVLTSCAGTTVLESPKTGYAPAHKKSGTPELIWTSQDLKKEYEFLGSVRVRSWTYQGAIGRLIDGGKELKADAVIDVHYEKIGFLTQMQAFAIQFK